MSNTDKAIAKVKQQVKNSKKEVPAAPVEEAFNGKKLLKGGSAANKEVEKVEIGAVSDEITDDVVDAVIAPKLQESTFVRDIPAGSVEVGGVKTKLYRDHQDGREFYYTRLEHGSKMRVYL